MTAVAENRVHVWATPVRWKHASIEALAKKVAEHLKIDRTTDLAAVIESLGGIIRIRDEYEDIMSDIGDAKEESGSLIVYSPKSFTVFIPSYTSVRRDRFTIAHELGHYFLHYLYGLVKNRSDYEALPIMHARRSGADQAEIEANVFAAALLMPRDEIEAAVKKIGRDIAPLANHFSVSRTAIQTRLAKLGHFGE